jgi:type III pantothenate kinase
MDQFFIVDVGNTSTKWAISDRQRILKEHEFPTSKFIEIKGKITQIDLPNNLSGAIISCVVPEALAGIREYLSNLGVLKPLVVSWDMDLGIGICYPEPANIGADRLVNAVAAASLYGVPAIVVDFGTAVTFDVISKNKEYLGGAIAPGLRSMTHYLHEHTALLPHISLEEPISPIGKNTVEAMRVGAVIGYRGLIREILAAITRSMNLDASVKTKVQVIATGGHSSLIASKIPEIQHIDPLLTLNGLRLLYDRLTPTSLTNSKSTKKKKD